MKRFIEQEAQEKAEEIMIKVGMKILVCESENSAWSCGAIHSCQVGGGQYTYILVELGSVVIVMKAKIYEKPEHFLHEWKTSFEQN